MDFGTKLDLLRTVSIQQISQDSIIQVKDELLTLNKEQMYDGKRADGQDIAPSYFNDPYFKQPGAGQRYSAWKDKITPNPKRSSGTPNLFINGTYYDTITITVLKDRIEYNSNFEQGALEQKYGPKIYSLGGEYRQRWIEFLQPVFMNNVRDACKL